MFEGSGVGLVDRDQPVGEMPLPIEQMSVDQALDEVKRTDTEIAKLHARQNRALARIAELRRDPATGKAGEFVGAEVAMEMRWSRHAGDRKVDVATDLVQRLPDTVAALGAGQIDLAKATAVLDLTAPLKVEKARQVEQVVLTRASTQTLRQLKDRTRKAVQAIDPEGQQERHEQRVTQRRAEYRPAEDGMAWVAAYLPADQAMAVYKQIVTQARVVKAPGDERTLQQICADVFVDHFLGSNRENVKVEVQVMLPGTINTDGSVTLAAGATGGVAQLAGYGPITTETALELAGSKDATWRRILTDPSSGTVLDVGRTRYRPPKALADHVRARDKTCRTAGCHNPAEDCELDHTTPFPEGPTAEYNLADYCKHCHRMKHTKGWKLTQPKPGYFIWTTPTGRTYEVDPEVDYPFIAELEQAKAVSRE